MVDYSFLTQAEVDDMVGSALGWGLAVGLLIGIILAIIVLYFQTSVNRRNFKMWLLELAEPERAKIIEHLEDVSESLDELAKSNTRLFKRFHNDFCDLTTYLKKKWMQN